MWMFLHLCDSNLIVRWGKPEEVIANLIKQLGSVSTVAFHEEVDKGLALFNFGVTVTPLCVLIAIFIAWLRVSR